MHVFLFDTTNVVDLALEKIKMQSNVDDQFVKNYKEEFTV